MGKQNSRNEDQVKAFITGVAEEIKNHDLDEKAGAGVFTAIQLTLAGKCGGTVTVSYECTSNNESCG
jgi:hypothetical protein